MTIDEFDRKYSESVVMCSYDVKKVLRISDTTLKNWIREKHLTVIKLSDKPKSANRFLVEEIREKLLPAFYKPSK